MQAAERVDEFTAAEADAIDARGFIPLPEDVPDHIAKRIRFVPSEYVLICDPSLPSKRRPERLASLPFAVEDMLAAPLESLHYALGSNLEDGRWLSAVVDKATMTAWIDEIESAEDSGAMLVPDVFILPVPMGGYWNIATIGDRVLVRLPDATGFVTSRHNFPAFRRAAGRPDMVLLFGDAAKLGPVTETDDAIEWPDVSEMLNLRQGPYAKETGQIIRFARFAGLAATALICATTLLAALDVSALSSVEADRTKSLQTAFEEKFSQAPNGTDAASAIRGFEAADAPQNADSFLLAFGETAEALRTQNGLNFDVVRYNGRENILEIEVEAGSLAQLQAAQAQLVAAGLASNLGAANAIPGGMTGTLTVMADGVK